MEPRISVLMPLYNVAPFLEEAMESVLQQSFTNFEVIAVDDCSTDNTLEVLESIKDDRIRIFRKEQNSGIVGTMNLGLEHVRAPYIVRMDGDDISTPDRFQKLYDHMETNLEIGVCSSSIKRFGAINDVWTYEKDPDRNKAALVFEHRIGHAASILRTELFREHGIRYRDDHPYMEDYHLFYELRDLTRCTCLPDELYHYRILDHNSTVRNAHTRVERKKAFYQMVLAELKLDQETNAVELHYALGNGKLTAPLAELHAWKAKLIAKNHQLAIYPHFVFQEILEEKWQALFFRVADDQPKLMSEYIKLSGGQLPADQKKYWRRLRFNRLIGRAK